MEMQKRRQTYGSIANLWPRSLFGELRLGGWAGGSVCDFFAGLPQRCKFCHNPDTWDLNDPSAHSCTADELLEKALRCRGYWGKKGGITVSGGEPLLQMDFLLELFTKAKAQGIHTCIDTAGHPFVRTEPFFSKFQALMAVTDLLLVDIKRSVWPAASAAASASSSASRAL